MIRNSFLYPKGRKFTEAEAFLDLCLQADSDNCVEFTYGELSNRWFITKGAVEYFIKKLCSSKISYVVVSDEVQTIIRRTKICISKDYMIFTGDFQTTFRRLTAKKSVKNNAPIIAQQTMNLDAEQSSGTEPGTQPVPEQKTQQRKAPKVFVPPTLEEVVEYFKLNNFSEESGETAFKYYNEANWHDGKGKKVLNWKQKMISVWFRDKNKNDTTGYQQGSNHNEETTKIETLKEMYSFLRNCLQATPDGSEKENHINIDLCLKRLAQDYPEHPAEESLRAIIKEGLKLDFYSNNITSFKYLFQNLTKIINTLKNEKPTSKADAINDSYNKILELRGIDPNKFSSNPPTT